MTYQTHLAQSSPSYPPVCQRLKESIRAADALLFVTPEYNRSLPGVLKNAIDIASRPYGTNSFAGKPGAVIGASIGAPGASMAQRALITVAASGIGLEIARAFSEAGAKVFMETRQGKYEIGKSEIDTFQNPSPGQCISRQHEGPVAGPGGSV